MSLSIPRLSYQKLGQIADNFLQEYQAYSFASQVLVPKKLLLKELKNKFGRIPSAESPEAFIPIIQELLNTFQVSGEVMLRRLQKEAIVKTNS